MKFGADFFNFKDFKIRDLRLFDDIDVLCTMYGMYNVVRGYRLPLDWTKLSDP